MCFESAANRLCVEMFITKKILVIKLLFYSKIVQMLTFPVMGPEGLVSSFQFGNCLCFQFGYVNSSFYFSRYGHEYFLYIGCVFHRRL